MTKKNFLFLIFTVMGGLLFALGMCMCLIPDWNTFKPGMAMTGVGIAALVAIGIVRWVMAGKPVAKVNWKKAGKIAYCVATALVFGTGMALAMAFEKLLPGMLVGIVGIVMALGLIPMFKGLK